MTHILAFEALKISTLKGIDGIPVASRLHDLQRYVRSQSD